MTNLIKIEPVKIENTKFGELVKSQSMIYPISRDNNFNLQYPDLEKRRFDFLKYILEETKRFDTQIQYYKTKDLFSELIYGDEHLDFLLIIQNNTESNTINRYSELIKNLIGGGEIIELYYLIDLMYVDTSYIVAKYNSQSNNGISRIKETYKLLYQHLTKLLVALNKYNLDYYFEKTTGRIVKKLDGINTNLINSNITKVSNLEEYQACINEFLLPNTKIDRLNSLARLKDVLQKTIDEKHNLRFADVNKVVAIIKNNVPSELKSNFEFIIKNIHHTQKDTVTGRAKNYNFDENEYTYWWLLINNLIYIYSK